MTSKPSRRVPKEAAATTEEIVAEIEALTPMDLVKLKRYADFCIMKVGRYADGQTGDDLMQTAVISILDDNRRWNKSKVGFIELLKGAIKSISSNWANSVKRGDRPILEADLHRENVEGEIFNPLDNVKGQTPDQEIQKVHNTTLRQIDDLFKDDPKAQMVLEAWKEGYDHAGVREFWDLSQKDYNAIVRKIRRRIYSAGITRD